MRSLDIKYHIEGEEIVRTKTGEAIPHDEPVFFVRGRDSLAVILLEGYLMLCRRAGTAPLHQEQISGVIDRFRLWRAAHPEKMKLPDPA